MKRLAIDLLGVLVLKIPDIESPPIVCDLTETVSRLESLLVEESEDKLVSASTAETNRTAETENLERGEVPSASVSPPDDQEQIGSDLRAEVVRTMAVLSCRSTELVGVMTATELRRLVTVYSLSPYRADKLLDKIEHEVERRTEQLKELVRSSSATVQDRLLDITSQAELLRKTLRGESESPFAGLRDRLRNFFVGEDETEQDGDATEKAEAQAKHLEMADETLTSVIGFGEYADILTSTCRSSLDKATQNMEEGALFELGRCNELIAHYRRINFDSGKRENRYDQESRRVVTKRILSRLLP